MKTFPHFALSCLLVLYTASAVGKAEPAVRHGEATIKRDEYGVPHVYAGSAYSLFYGFGYALAEDHLFQMEMMRRTARGTVAEVLGPKYLDHDKAVRRSYDFGSLIRQYGTLKGDDRDIFEGYAAGFNARVREVLLAPKTLQPREFTDFGFSPSEFSPLDILAAYEHSMALRYSDSNAELSNLALSNDLVTRYGKEKAWKLFGQLRWNSDPLAPTTVPREANPAVASELPALRSSSPAYLSSSFGAASRTSDGEGFSLFAANGPDASPHESNVWLVSPAKTQGGVTVLMNGPQMGDFSPGYIWGIGLHGAGYDLVASGPLGSPWLIFGTNGKIAWGATAGMGDTVDIYQEKLDPKNPHRYFYAGSYRDMTRRVEVISVHGSIPQQIEVFSTIHGTVIDVDAAEHLAYSRKRSWDGSEVRSLISWMHAMRAGDFTEWRAAISGVSLSINNYYADAKGNIGYTFLGKFPRRPANQDRRLPASGTGDMEWQGFLPFETNPWVENPAQGYLANWNNKPRSDYNSSDSLFWGVIDHLNEITELLESPKKLSVSDIWDINRRIAYRDNNARYFIPLIGQAAPSWTRDSSAGRGAALLLEWDQLTVDPARGNSTSPGYTLFQRFLHRLIGSVLAGKVPTSVYGLAKPGASADDLTEPTVSPFFPTMGTKIVYNALLGKAAGVPQEIDLLDGKSPPEVLRQALGSAFDDLVKARGADPKQWVDAPSEHTFVTTNYAGIPDAPEAMSLKIKAAMNRGTENNRIVFGPFGVSACDVTPPGQSGNISPDGMPSPHYKDQLPLYAAFECKSQWLEQTDVARHAKDVKDLKF